MNTRAIVVAVAIVALSSVAYGVPVPSFPQSYTVQETDTIYINQGGVVKGNQVCCPLHASQCKVQVEEEAGLNYIDATGKRTLFQPYGSEQSILSLYNNNKQYLIQNNTCQYYCPLQDDDFPTFGPPSNATFMGTKVINGKTCNNFQWKETILGIIVMEISDFFADASTNEPVQQVNQLTPFGQPIGTETSDYANFKGGEPPASIFNDIQGIANCPVDPQGCNQNQKDMNIMTRALLRNKAWQTYARRHSEWMRQQKKY